MISLVNFYSIFFLLLPISLVLGPGLADSIISLLSILLIFYIIYRKEYRYFNSNFFYIFNIICIYLIILSLTSKNILLSLESSLFYFRFGIFAFAIFFISQHNKYFNKYFLFSLLFATSLTAVSGLCEFFFKQNFLYFFEFFNPQHAETLKVNQNFIGRVSGFFGDELKLGSYLVRLLPVTIGLLFFNYSKSKNFYFLLLPYLILISLTIFVTGERTAFFMLIIFFILFFILIKKTRKIFSISLFVLFILLSLVTFSNQELKTRMIEKTLQQFVYKGKGAITDDSVNGYWDGLINKDTSKSIDIEKYNFFSIQHEVVYKTSLKIFRDNKFFGIGPKMFREICKIPKYHTYVTQDGSVMGCQTHSHNTYIQILTETGIIGFIILLSFFIYISFKLFLYFIYYSSKKLNEVQYLQIFCLINIFLNLWPLMPTGSFFNNWLSIVYFIPIGFLLFTNSKKNEI